MPIKLGMNGTEAWSPKTVNAVLMDTAEKFPDNLALAVKRDNKWQKWYSNGYKLTTSFECLHNIMNVL